MPTEKNSTTKASRRPAKAATLPKGYQGHAFETADKRVIFCYAAPDNPESFGPCFIASGTRQRFVHDDLMFRGDLQAAIDDLIAFGKAHLKRIQ